MRGGCLHNADQYQETVDRSFFELEGVPTQESEPKIELAMSRYEELLELADKSEELEARLATRKLIDRAKGRLMDHWGLTEQESFRFLQETAMREVTSMNSVSERVLTGDLEPS